MHHFESLLSTCEPGSSTYDSKALGTAQASRTQKKEVIKEKVHLWVQTQVHMDRLTTCDEWLSAMFHAKIEDIAGNQAGNGIMVVHPLVQLHFHAERSINTCLFAAKKYLAFVS